MHELVSYLEMSKIWDEIKYNNPNNIAVAKFLVLSKWKERKKKFKDLEEALVRMKISTHDLCQVRFHKNYIKNACVFYIFFEHGVDFMSLNVYVYYGFQMC